jgi:hypothetical protein
LNLGDLVEHWTLVGAERDLVAAKHRDTQLGFRLLLKFYGRFGRFPRGRAELHDDAVDFVARQLGVDASSFGFYEWTGCTIKRHRAEFRVHHGFRECTVADAEALTGWLAGEYAQKERRFELVKDALLAECRSRLIEPPTPDRVERIVRSWPHQAEKALAERIAGRLPAPVGARLLGSGHPPVDHRGAPPRRTGLAARGLGAERRRTGRRRRRGPGAAALSRLSVGRIELAAVDQAVSSSWWSTTSPNACPSRRIA